MSGNCLAQEINTISPGPRLEPGLLDLEVSGLPMRPLHLPSSLILLMQQYHNDPMQIWHIYLILTRFLGGGKNPSLNDKEYLRMNDNKT